MKFLPLAFLVLLPCMAVADEERQTTIGEQSYRGLVINKVQIEADKDKTNPDELKWYEDLENESTAYIIKTFKGEGFAVVQTADSDGKVAVINTQAKFNPGNQAVRWVGGLFGAGKATADVTMTATDSVTNSVIATKSYATSMRMGGFGGSSRSFFIGAIDGVWNAIYEDIVKLVKAAK